MSEARAIQIYRVISRMKLIFLATFAIMIVGSPSSAKEVKKKMTLEHLGKAVVASRDCGDGTKIGPGLVSVYVQRFADQEMISFEKSKYMALAKGDETLFNLKRTGKKNEFCLSVIE